MARARDTAGTGRTTGPTGGEEAEGLAGAVEGMAGVRDLREAYGPLPGGSRPPSQAM